MVCSFYVFENRKGGRWPPLKPNPFYFNVRYTIVYRLLFDHPF